MRQKMPDAHDLNHRRPREAAADLALIGPEFGDDLLVPIVSIRHFLPHLSK
jgi:hypothetical protein